MSHDEIIDANEEYFTSLSATLGEVVVGDEGQRVKSSSSQLNLL